MELKSKEDILAKYVRCECWPANDGGKPVYNSSCPRHSTDTESAMDDWAEQVAISFAEWISINGWYFNKIKRWSNRNETSDNIIIVLSATKSTEELYTLFLTHQSI
jgi:hypothetical protein